MLLSMKLIFVHVFKLKFSSSHGFVYGLKNLILLLTQNLTGSFDFALAKFFIL
jgi:hypothetical protein